MGHPVAWLSLDEDDNDPVRFWRYLIATLQTVEPALGEMVLGALESPGAPLEALATTLINEIAAYYGRDAIYDTETMQRIDRPPRTR